LKRWGSARWRVVREAAGDRRFRPQRVRCASCGVTQVVLPPDVVVRRRDAVVRIGQAWRLFVAGAGARQAARLLALPMETVRGWLRRLRQRSGIRFGGTPGDDRGRLGSALAYEEAAARDAGWRVEAEIWRFVAYRTQGQLLANTNWP
jgi:hypothetical protein